MLGGDLSLQVDKHRLAGGDVAIKRNAQSFQCHRFAGEHGHAVGAVTHAQWTDSKGIAECQQPVPGNHGDDGVGAAQAPVNGAYSGENVCNRCLLSIAGPAQLVRQHIEQHFRVTLGVDVTVIGFGQIFAQGLCIGQIAVVHHDDAERGVDIKRLGFFFTVCVAGCGVAHLTQAAIAGQGAHVARAKDVAHHALGLVHEKLAIHLCGDAGGILAAMLQQQQGIVEQLVHMAFLYHGDDSTHACQSFKKRLKSIFKYM